jgi:hypothetical protein
MERACMKSAPFIVCIFLLSCIRQITPPIRNVPPLLVVEGMITTDSTPYSVNLSYSGPYTNTYEVGLDTNKYFIPDAKVTIENDLGDSTTCTWVGLGTYQSTDPSFVGTVGRTYTLKVYLSNGLIYQSKPETIAAVPPIDSLTLFYDTTYITDVRPNQYIISVNTLDPAMNRNYYRWTAFGYVARKSWGGGCLPTPYWSGCGDPFSCLCHALCDSYLADNQANILSDQFINGREIIQPVFYVPIYWLGKDFIQVNQYSISQDAYIFWQQYQAQTNRTGSILDPLPAPLTGNIFNTADTSDVALGLFSASAVTTKKLVIIPFNLQQYWLESIAGQFIEKGDCQVVYPGALPDDTDAPGWENAQVIELH